MAQLADNSRRRTVWRRPRWRGRLMQQLGSLLLAAAALLAAVAVPTAAQLLGGGRPPSPPPPPVRTTMLPITPMLLPGCPREGVLASTNPVVFPGRAWRSMSVEQQAMHPINLVFMNLAGVPSTDPIPQVAPCLHSWGIVRGSVVKLSKNYKVGNFPTMNTVVLIMRTQRGVFVVFRATDDDWIADFDCMYTDDLHKEFDAPPGSGKLQLHKGFWSAFKVVDSQLLLEVNKAVLKIKTSNPFAPTPSVWFVGHSLAGALACIAALKLSLDPLFLGQVGGVVSYGSPRVGNQAWQTLYNKRLMDVTLRYANFRDFVAALPGRDQVCVSSTNKVLYTYRHVGRAAQLCPGPNGSGLEEFRMWPRGTEGSCVLTEFPSISTHLLGHYFDGWRRAYAGKFGRPAGMLLAAGVHVRSVMCSECATAVKPYPLPDNKAARNDGVVSCVNTRSCADKELFGLVSWAGLAPTALYRADATCDATTLTCQVPIPLEEVGKTLQAISTLAEIVVNSTSSGAAAGAPVVAAAASPAAPHAEQQQQRSSAAAPTPAKAAAPKAAPKASPAPAKAPAPKQQQHS